MASRKKAAKKKNAKKKTVKRKAKASTKKRAKRKAKASAKKRAKRTTRRRAADAQAEAAGEVPIGTVLDWWYHPDLLDAPLNYEICDGRVIRHRGSPLRGRNTPDLRGLFVRGAPNARPQPYRVYGSDTHNHRFDLPAHRHEVTIPKHAHVAARARVVDGQLVWRDGQEKKLCWWGDGSSDAGRGKFPLSISTKRDKDVKTDVEKAKTQRSTEAGKLARHPTDSQSHLPRHALMVKIMRVV